MTLTRQGFESGIPPGNVDATTDTGANDNSLPTVYAGTAGSTIVFDNVVSSSPQWPLHGKQYATLSIVGGAAGYFSKTLPGSTNSAAGRFEFWFPTTPLSVPIAAIRNASGNVLLLGTSGTGHMTLQDATPAVIWTSSNVMPTVPFWLEWGAAKGTTSSNGTLKVSYGLGSSTSPVESGPTTPTARNAGTAVLTEVRAGKVGVTAAAVTCKMDSGFIQDGVTGPIGYIAPSKPGKPTGVTGAPGGSSGEIDAGWMAPSDIGTSALTAYTVTPYLAGVAQTPQVFASTATAQTLTGLTPGAVYTLTAKVTNTSGYGDESRMSGTVTAASTPGAVDGGEYLLTDAGWVLATEYLLVPVEGADPVWV